MEKLQKISDDPLMECPSCHESALKKLVSAAGFRLSGSGWYETDFKKDGKRNLAAGDSAESSESSGSSSSETATNSASSDSSSGGTSTTEKSSGSSDSASKGGSSESKAS